MSLPPAPPFPIAVDNTMVSTWRACPKKFWWGYYHGWAPTDESVHLVAGGAFARGLEVTRKAYFDQGIPFEDAIALGGAALIAVYGTLEPFGSPKTALNLLGALGSYFEEWPITGGVTPYLPPGATLHDIECRIAVPIPGTRHPTTGDPIIYGGRFDFRGHYQGMLAGVDDKTTSQLGPSWYDRWKWNSQILGYAWGSNMLGRKLGCFIVRGTSILAKSFGHAEPIQMLAEWKLAAFEKNLVLAVQRMIEDFEAQRWDYAMGQSCNAYGGCPYLTLCDSEKPQEWIATNYVQRSWNPLLSKD